MQHIGYSLVDAQGTELQFWGDTLSGSSMPHRVIWPNGDITEGVSGPLVHGEWKLVKRYGLLGAESSAVWNGEIIVRSFQVTLADVAAERERRLALGFNYDFGDARGVHRIGTTDADMVGWGEVSTYVGALIDSGDVTTLIAIATNTGPCQVTAPEWRSIEIAAAEFRQPLWSASFALMAMTPIPSDYQNDSYWT
jgi:hypothetical protein